MKNPPEQSFKLTPEQDGRVKITDEMRAKIEMFYEQGKGIREITREVGCSRRSVQFILFPERLAHAKALFKERRKDGRYYDRPKHTVAIRNWRKKKRDILKEKGE